MTTDDLIETLTFAADPVAPARAGRLAAPVLAGAAVAAGLLLVWLGTRPLGQAFGSASFWMKAFYAAALTLAGALMAWGLARPAGRPGRGPWIGAVAFGAVAAVSGLQLATAPPGAAQAMWLGQTWALCPFRILALAVPIFAGAVIGLRRMAPTRLRAAGAAAGLLAGGAGATVYGFYCQETTAAFLATWYTLGIAACAALGALFGPRLLRW